ncbi:adenosylcobalamin-dependent ribonucleoside-diphosphate reductase [Candidatus Woesearchaeota archaeon]|nr:adenosylcobalamin-dependent ribonucleoside-diphosphate reductase [Candidatus Woesearchaeota archaeon]
MDLPDNYGFDIPDYKKWLSLLYLSPLANDLLKLRYLKRDSEGNICEDVVGMFYRVAKNVASADNRYGGNVVGSTEKFLKHMIELDLIPASPILMNAGNTLQFLFSDHALGVPDSVEEIFDVLKISATIQQHGGGVGFNFSSIRPKHDSVSGMKNVAFGPLSVMKIFDTSFSAIIQGGRRSGANMAILSIDHPDVLSFIEAKKNVNVLTNFNLSVAVTDEFMKAVKDDSLFNLINPRNNEVMRSLPARYIFDALVQQAWSTGDPGIVFIDEMNRKHPFKNCSVLGTGSCGQYQLESFEGVPYMHINLSKIVTIKNSSYKVDEQKLRDLVRTAVHFLDNCIDVHRYPNSRLEEATKRVRKIGLGVLGFADLLFKMRISYGSDDCLHLIDSVMSIIQDESQKASHNLALQRAPFPAYKESTHKKPLRNATMTSIAPTGSTSLIAGTSQSIEPVYAFSFTTTTSEGEELTVLNSAFQEAVDTLTVDRTSKIQLKFVDSIQNIPWLDDDFKHVFKTAMDIDPKDHVAVMSRFQKYVDNSISKTINIPHEATQQDISEIFFLAYESSCKGITIYRDRCRDSQALLTKPQTRLSAFDESKV